MTGLDRLDVATGRKRAIVLVEGLSDLRAIEALAERRGRDLAAEGVAIVPIGGAKNIRAFLQAVGPGGPQVAGLCDAGEAGDFRRGLERAGFGPVAGNAGLEQLGFFVCDADLEDELLRALGTAAVQRVIEEEGELASFRTLQKQPAQRERSLHQQMRRFIGTRSGRKIRYARLLVEALDGTNVPPPLDQLLAAVGR